MGRMMACLAALVVASNAWAYEMGDDGLHKTDWMRDTFKDLSDDLAEANAEGKRLMVMIEQRGCVYCTEMHQKIFPLPEIDAYIREHYFVVQLNMFGDVGVTDFDGTELPEKDMVRRWGAMFTPTIMFFPEEVADDSTASQAAVAVMPGAFEADTTIDMLTWVVEKGYEGEESFQKYHGRMYKERSE